MGCVRALPSPVAAFALGDRVHLVIARLPRLEGRQATLLIGNEPLPKPAYVGTLPLNQAEDILVVAVRLTDAQLGGDCSLNGGEADLRLPSPRPAAELLTMLRALPPSTRLRLLRQMIDTVGVWFKLAAQPAFQQFVGDLILGLHGAPGAIPVGVALGGGLWFLRGRGLVAKAVQQVVILNGPRYRRSAFLPHAKTADVFELVVEGLAEPLERDVDVLLLGTEESSLWRLNAVARRPIAWWLASLARDPDGAGTLDYLLPKTVPHLGNGDLAECLRLAARAVQPRRRSLHLPSVGVAAAAELVVATPDGGVFAKGWQWDSERLIERIDVVTPFAARRPLPTHRLERDDVRRGLKGRMPERMNPADCHGFAGYCGDLQPTPAGGLYRLIAVLRTGSEHHLVPPPAPSSPGQLRDAVLQAIPSTLPALRAEDLLGKVLAPAVAAFHRAHLAGDRVAQAYHLGRPPSRPRISLIVPLYRNLSFLRTQYAKFALNRRAADLDVIYVLDSPEQADALCAQLQGLVLTYGFPVTVVVHERNLGYAPAVNSGLRYARGRRVVLLNSDVVPESADWLDALSDGLKRHRAAAVGPKLLFDDDSLQHAGLYYAPYIDGRWINRHYYKGYPRDFAAAALSRRVPGLTGACLMLERALLERLGGLSEDFVIGDYEDSDLCLRLWSQGHACAYVAEAELYHFERRSIVQHDGYQGSAAVLYNRWLHWQRWGRVIPDVMASFPAAADVLPHVAPVPAMQVSPA